MKIDTALKEFVEKYNERSMRFIQDVSRDHAMVANKCSLSLFNIQEGFDRFREYLKGYGSYKMENVDNEKASPQDVIHESVSKFIESQLFKPTDVRYPDLPAFIESYINGVKSLNQTVSEVKSRLMEAGIDGEAIGDINDFTDEFMTKLHESFDPAMDKILWASGYNTKVRLENAGKGPKKQAAIFL